MTFEQINNMIVIDVADILLARIQLDKDDIDYIPTTEEFEAELVSYKNELKVIELSNGISNLVQNNCATTAAFPEANGNHSEWLLINILNNADIEDAILKLQTIQAKEIELAAKASAAAILQAKIEKGKQASDLCQNILCLITGFNLERALTTEQINTMKATFADAKEYLKDGQPWAAKALISAIEPDGIIVTQEMHDAIMSMFTNSGLAGL